MNNSAFGKTMENIRKQRNIKVATNKESYLKTVIKLNFKSGVFFGKNLRGSEMGKIKVVMNKPMYLGQAIQDLSKIGCMNFLTITCSRSMIGIAFSYAICTLIC